MLLSWLALILGLAILVWSADRFIDSASLCARRLGVPPLFIGIIIVGFGTSAPELVVSAIAASQNSPELALGNAFGSNIANVGLVLGLAALVRPIHSRSPVIRREILLLLGVSLLAGGLLLDGELGRGDALVLLAAFVVLLAWSVKKSFSGGPSADDSPGNEAGAGTGAALVWLLVSLVLLLASSRLLVWGAVQIALSLGISELIIGLTVVALGTSLPELASVIAAARKGEHDLALGNIVGSGLFNTLAVVGLAGVITPFPVADGLLYRDWPVMVALVVMLQLLALIGGARGLRLSRWVGALLLAIYVGYLGWLNAGLGL
ncbi:calcium/sodium antiporter [Alloalcanivorax sp. C16-2]|uniref:calcium/sodium antiporter n=1 Tax=Alloalcanivorax sp. C16-2 TaxID=3390052 RepID=UPI0039710C1F